MLAVWSVECLFFVFGRDKNSSDTLHMFYSAVTDKKKNMIRMKKE